MVIWSYSPLSIPGLEAIKEGMHPPLSTLREHTICQPLCHTMTWQLESSISYLDLSDQVQISSGQMSMILCSHLVGEPHQWFIIFESLINTWFWDMVAVNCWFLRLVTLLFSIKGNCWRSFITAFGGYYCSCNWHFFILEDWMNYNFSLLSWAFLIWLLQ